MEMGNESEVRLDQGKVASTKSPYACGGNYEDGSGNKAGIGESAENPHHFPCLVGILDKFLQICFHLLPLPLSASYKLSKGKVRMDPLAFRYFQHTLKELRNFISASTINHI